MYVYSYTSVIELAGCNVTLYKPVLGNAVARPPLKIELGFRKKGGALRWMCAGWNLGWLSGLVLPCLRCLVSCSWNLRALQIRMQIYWGGAFCAGGSEVSNFITLVSQIRAYTKLKLKIKTYYFSFCHLCVCSILDRGSNAPRMWTNSFRPNRPAVKYCYIFSLSYISVLSPLSLPCSCIATLWRPVGREKKRKKLSGAGWKNELPPFSRLGYLLCSC